MTVGPRRPSPPRELQFMPASAGIDSTSSPNYVPATRAPVVRNLMPGRVGKLVLRGGLGHTGGGPWFVSAADPGSLPRGILIVDRNILAAGLYVPWGGAASTIAHAFSPCANSVELQGKCYAVTNGTGQPIIRWAGTSAAPVALANGPQQRTTGIAVHLSRLFTLSGGPSTQFTSVTDVELCWSDPGGSPTDNVNDWKDDASGLVNKILVPTNGDFGSALARVGNSLAVFGQNSAFMLLGTTPANFVLRNVVQGIGCLHQRAVASYNDVCYFLSAKGLYRFDGVSAVDVSQPVRTALLAALDATVAAPTPVVGLVGPTTLMVTVTSADGLSMLFNACYDILSDAWWTFDSNSMPLGAPIAIAQHVAYGSLMFDGPSLTAFGSTLVPEVNHHSDDSSSVGSPTGVQGSFQSRIAQLVSPTHYASLRRIHIDYAFQYNAIADPGAGGYHAWTVSLCDGQGNGLAGLSWNLPAQGSGGPPVRQRASYDCLAEVTDVQVRVGYSGNGGTLGAAELYDITMEYEPTQQQ